MGHVLTRLAGHGLVLLPYWPYTFEREPSVPGGVLVSRLLPGGERQQALVDPAHPAECHGVVDVDSGPDHPHWLLETSLFAMPWPDGYAVDSAPDPDDQTPFYLHGPAGELIFPQGPARVDGPDALVAPDQTVLRHRRVPGAEVVEVGYQHDGEAWWQAHFLMRHDEHHTLVLTAQARQADAPGALAAAEFMVRGSA